MLLSAFSTSYTAAGGLLEWVLFDEYLVWALVINRGSYTALSRAKWVWTGFRPPVVAGICWWARIKSE